MFNWPIEEVFALLANVENDADWSPSLETTRAPEVPVRVGSVVRYRVKSPVGRFTEVWELTEDEPNRGASSKTVGGPVPITDLRTFVSVDGGTRVTVRCEMLARGLFKLVEPLLMWFGKRQAERDLPKLKEPMNVTQPFGRTRRRLDRR